jgi:hypothetical protein
MSDIGAAEVSQSRRREFGDWLMGRLGAEERGEYFYFAAYAELDRK